MPNKMLNLAIDGDILELAVMRRMYEMAKKEEYLKQHRFKVYQGKDGRWFTYVPGGPAILYLCEKLRRYYFLFARFYRPIIEQVFGSKY